jgi:hypothetical protein
LRQHGFASTSQIFVHKYGEKQAYAEYTKK